MAYSTCPKCDNTTFEMETIVPRGSNFKYNTIQCAMCGAVVGVVEYEYVSSLIRRLAEKLRIPLD